MTTLDNARPSLAAGARVQAIVPTDMDSAYRLAKAVCLAGMAPRGLDTPEKAMIAIMHGLEIGLTPLAALQRIAVVNGRPTLWGDGAMALVRASGACEWVRERVEGEGDKRTATCEAKRVREPEPIRRTFSVADARRAGLWGKQGPWQQYPDRMLSMRARAFALRDGFADALGGMYLREELEDVPAAPRPPSPPSPPPAPELAPPAPEPVSAADPLATYANDLKIAEALDDGNNAMDVIEAAWATHIEPLIAANTLTAEQYERASALDNAARETVSP